ncbi:MAG: hypothetical protein LQ346_007399, partial [Caloplaca aetnensis]
MGSSGSPPPPFFPPPFPRGPPAGFPFSDVTGLLEPSYPNKSQASLLQGSAICSFASGVSDAPEAER